MKRTLIATTLFALALSSPAFADKGKGHGKHKDHPRSEHRDDDRDWRGDDRHDDRRHDNGRHLGHYKKWARGQHIPREYLVTRYYIDDYRSYRLDAPPRGYRWVRPYEDDKTYYLVQVTTGLISRIFGG